MAEQGYTDSQTWQAWRSSFQVLWDNTEICFVASFIFCFIMALLTWAYANPMVRTHKRFVKLMKMIEETPPKQRAPADSIGLNPTAKLAKTIENQMTEEEKNLEKEAQKEQMATIFRMMQEQKDKFGHTSMEEINEQMKFYCG